MERSPVRIGIERGMSKIDVKIRALKRKNVDRETDTDIAKISSRDALRYFPAYREKKVLTRSETAVAKQPNSRISFIRPGGSLPSNRSSVDNNDATNQMVASANIC